MKFSIKDYFSKYDQIPSFLKKSLMEDFIFCAVLRNYYIKSWIKTSTLKIEEYFWTKSSMENFIFCAVHREFSGLEMISWFPGNESIIEQ